MIIQLSINGWGGVLGLGGGIAAITLGIVLFIHTIWSNRK